MRDRWRRSIGGKGDCGGYDYLNGRKFAVIAHRGMGSKIAQRLNTRDWYFQDVEEAGSEESRCVP